MRKKYVFIYADEGVSSFSLKETIASCEKELPSYLVETIDHKTLIHSSWEKETSLFIIPGGRDIPYDRLLRGKGTHKIRSYVSNGGSFLGICAGAYFSSSQVIFEKGTPLEVDEKRDLNFYPGAAIGTLYRDRPFSYLSEQGSHAAFISFENTHLPIYYNGGCYFENPECFSEQITILGRYQDEGDKAAIVACKIGRGNAVLSGVHFEVQAASLTNTTTPSDVYHTLSQFEEERQKIFSSILTTLKILPYNNSEEQ